MFLIVEPVVGQYSYRYMQNSDFVYFRLVRLSVVCLQILEFVPDKLIYMSKKQDLFVS